MGAHRPTAGIRPRRHRVIAFAASGALPLSLLLFSAAPAQAEESPSLDSSIVNTQTLMETPDTVIRVGTVQVARPDWLSAEQARQVNDATAGAETSLTQALQSSGLDSARSGQIARTVLGNAAIGAVVGSVAASPVASVGAVIGVVSGVIAGLPFAPIGLVIVPAIGAALGYAMVAAPFAALGAAVGAAAGAFEGYLAPTTG
ncbi:hypothetical protein JK358_10440 [Nocardia sp. 2]|uniref:Uncharacterized protein n=1 Tax=Nocardia acididurans TaxID=2802282 RepID=A0ABS1M2C8_9NOCA|nr:hypothetical protein [Nocardia acididurans]MBL1074812.1 hypothetical protein [Nocardia acididurans]